MVHCGIGLFEDYITSRVSIPQPRRLSKMKCTVKLVWDDEAHVWITDSSDVPGLFLESESFDELITKVRAAAPELLLLNCKYEGPVYINFEAVRITTGLAMVS